MITLRANCFYLVASGTLLSLPLVLAGCAGITVTPLNVDGTAKKGVEDGLQYYMPKPYLLVTELPPASIKTTTTGDGNMKLDAAGVGGGNGDGNTNNSPDPTKTSNASAAPVSDTSFSGQTSNYVVKLIYLPDMSRPMAMRQHTGLFGSSEMKPALQDGWMLTSLDATADSKAAETLTALASLVGSAATATGTGGAAKAAGAAKAGTTLTTQSLADQLSGNPSYILKPGLYRFDYNRTTGQLKSLKLVTAFPVK